MSDMELREEWALVWDGEPSMSGQPHKQGVGARWASEEEALRAVMLVPQLRDKPNARLEVRSVSAWRPGGNLST